LEAVDYIEIDEIKGTRNWIKHIEKGMDALSIQSPALDRDILRNECGEIIDHPKDLNRIEGQPRVFKGPIACSNEVLKDPIMRDRLRDEFGVKAVEMEGSGIADATWTFGKGYLVVRGICDYCDSYKNNEWQGYAAVVAAAYTRGLIESMDVPA